MTRRAGLLTALLITASAAFCAEDVVLAARQFVLETVKLGRKDTELPRPFGKLQVLSGDDKGIQVKQVEGGRMDVAWDRLSPRELYTLARGLLPEGDIEGHLTVARLAIKAGVGVEMDRALEQLELAKPHAYSRIERVRAELAPPEPAPVAKTPDKDAGKDGTQPRSTDKKEQSVTAAPNVNHEGRALPPLPRFDQPILFNTPEADAILSSMQVFPKDNPWNEDISKLPVHPDSEAIIASIGAGKRIGFNRDMNFVLAPPNQPKIDVKLTDYGGESDKGPYPVPDNTPVEGWPMSGNSLDDIQRNGEGDRHMTVVDPWNMLAHDFYVGRKTAAGWQAACEATFDLRSNKTRPATWTSSDAAGLPLFPSIPRFDECERGMVEHAMRFTVRRTRKAFIWPATHYASRNTSPTVPAMGQRLRLKASVDVSAYPRHAKAIALALKKYGMFVADNGMDWLISVSPDPRLQSLDALRQLKGADFEVVETVDRH